VVQGFLTDKHLLPNLSGLYCPAKLASKFVVVTDRVEVLIITNIKFDEVASFLSTVSFSSRYQLRSRIIRDYAEVDPLAIRLRIDFRGPLPI
jgi:hypothetical protein